SAARSPEQTAHTVPALTAERRQNFYSLPAASVADAFGASERCRIASASRKPKTNSEVPAFTATYCLPATEYVIGFMSKAPPRFLLQRRAPLRASIPTKLPSCPPVNSRSEEVVRIPAAPCSAL